MNKEYYMKRGLLSLNNTKLEKSISKGFHTLGLSLAPEKTGNREGEKFNLCPYASKGCIASCIFTSGRGVFKDVEIARKNRTAFLHDDMNGFTELLYRDIKRGISAARRKGLTLAIRLNVFSDINWTLKAYSVPAFAIPETFLGKLFKEGIKRREFNLMELFPDVQFYDYTKDIKKMRRFLSADFPSNYYLTFSRSEDNEADCLEVLKKGGTVAIPFRGGLPKTWKGFEVINGDDHDLRFLDPKGVVVGLEEKGKGKKDISGFILSGE